MVPMPAKISIAILGLLLILSLILILILIRILLLDDVTGLQLPSLPLDANRIPNWRVYLENYFNEPISGFFFFGPSFCPKIYAQVYWEGKRKLYSPRLHLHHHLRCLMSIFLLIIRLSRVQ